MKHAYRWTALLVLSLLSACGGGGHSSSSAPKTVTYTIGGSISGLTASGLVLANGTATVSPAANATSFQFPAAVAMGTAYNVSVQTQPTGETCTIMGAGGTANANVTSVVVTCTATTPPVTYTIGGTASGLTAEGLVLQDNDGDSLTVPAYAASFQFATALPSGTAYAVTVKTLPAGETCTVADGSGTATGTVANVAVTCATAYAEGGSNVATVVVGPGPADPADQAFNIPYVSIKVCDTGTPQKCAVIDDVQVDTGSAGLRLLASAVTSAGLTLAPMQDTGGNPISECHPFGGADYSWGAIDSATVTIGDETTAGPIPVQVIDSSTPPTTCQGIGIQQSSVNDFDANGVLGIGLFLQDCGTVCTTPTNSWYYSCPAGGTCTQTAVALGNQVVNPVSTFTATGDDNGVALQLPSIPAAGQPTATGFLVFGIGNESNNALGSAMVLQPDASGYVSTTIDGQPGTLDGFFDSGSNYLAFDDSAVATCTDATDFYCPSSPPQSVTGENFVTGTSVPFSIDIASLDALSTSNFALDDVGGIGVSGQFDWGLPFFYGRTVFTAIQDASVGGTTYANGFYAF